MTATLSNDGKITPNEKFLITLNLENKNVLDIGSIDLSIASDLINQQETVSLGPLEQKTIIFSQDFDTKTPPQEDKLKIIASVGNKTVTTIERLPIEIISYSPFFIRDKQPHKSFLL